MIITKREDMVKSRICIYLGIAAVFVLAAFLGFSQFRPLFWFTLLLTIFVISLIDILIHNLLNGKNGPLSFLVTMLVLVLLTQSLFAALYYCTQTSGSSLAHIGGGPAMDFYEAFYFSGVTLFTVGYGDIVPIGNHRFTALIEIYLGHFLIFTIIAWGVGYFASRRLRGK